MSQSPTPSGTVASIHLHPSDRSTGLSSVDSVEFVAEAGLRGDQRYFGRKSRSTGGPSKRQVTLIERETLARHAAALGIPPLAPGIARSNIETSGIDLSTTVGRRLRVGTAVLQVVEPRTPCEKMDTIAPDSARSWRPRTKASSPASLSPATPASATRSYCSIEQSPEFSVSSFKRTAR